MRVWLSINEYAGPSMRDYLDMYSVDMCVRVHEVGGQNARKELGGGNWVLLCLNIDGVFDRVSGYD